MKWQPRWWRIANLYPNKENLSSSLYISILPRLLMCSEEKFCTQKGDKNRTQQVLRILCVQNLKSPHIIQMLMSQTWLPCRQLQVRNMKEFDNDVVSSTREFHFILVSVPQQPASTCATPPVSSHRDCQQSARFQRARFYTKINILMCKIQQKIIMKTFFFNLFKNVLYERHVRIRIVFLRNERRGV